MIDLLVYTVCLHSVTISDAVEVFNKPDWRLYIKGNEEEFRTAWERHKHIIS
jgi:hypothetical protein